MQITFILIYITVEIFVVVVLVLRKFDLKRWKFVK